MTQIQPSGTTTSNVVTFAVTSSIKSVAGAALYPGMTAQVTITTAEQKDVPVVPNAALTYARTRATPAQSGTGAARQGGAAAGSTESAQGFLMVLQNGAPVPVRITTGLSDGTNTAVTAGLQDGQSVVTGQTGGTTGTGAASGAGAATRPNQSSNPLTPGGPGRPPGR